VQHPSLEDCSAEGLWARRIAAAAPGRDREAEDCLCRSLAPRVRLYGLKYLRDPHAAADLAQEVLLLALQRLRQGSVREPQQIVSFVLGTCRQMVLDWQRGQRRHERILGTYADDFPLSAAAPVAVEIDGLRRCLEHLSERERAVLLMSFYDERPAQQVAAELATSAANIRVIRHRGIEHLRDCLGTAVDS
jgi:RNA polymerase sigma-70 factor (ECF subfamily)